MAYGIIIQGSSRSDGNTGKLVSLLREQVDLELIDLSKKTIHPYDYQYRHHDDDFLPIIRHIAQHADRIVFATPVYWYSMSGTMKVFFDRITDCLKTEKETGRKLRGKKMAMLSCGSEAEAIEGFEVPFRLSARYLGMTYLGNVHTWIDDNSPIEAEVIQRIGMFSDMLKKS